MAFALVSRSRSKTQGSVKPAPKQKSARAQHPADSRFGFAKPVFQPHTAALPTAPVIQAKLKIGEPDDKFEEEADRVADEVMRTPDSTVSGVASPGSGDRTIPHLPDAFRRRFERMCTECGEEDRKLQRMPSNTPAPYRVSRRLNWSVRVTSCAPSGGDKPSRCHRDSISRAVHQPGARQRHAAAADGTRFPGTALRAGPVRGPDSHRPGVGRARAGSPVPGLYGRLLTSSSRGEFEPRTSNGLRVLSHELTHAVQQGAVPATGLGPQTPQALGSRLVQEEWSRDKASPDRPTHT